MMKKKNALPLYGSLPGFCCCRRAPVLLSVSALAAQSANRFPAQRAEVVADKNFRYFQVMQPTQFFGLRGKLDTLVARS